MLKLNTKQYLILFLTLSFLAIMWFFLPTQDRSTYFNFADQRNWFNIYNAQDVLSNIPFFFVGLFGLKYIINNKYLSYHYKHAAFLISLGSILTAFGSSYFHTTPNPETLFWDRMPMTIGFTGVVTLLLIDRFHARYGYLFSFFLVLLGLLTVVGWNQGWMTLKPYLLVQYGCLLFVFLSVILTPSHITNNKKLLCALGLYLLAKITESWDLVIFNATTFISGHTIKHLLAAIAIYQILKFAKSTYGK